MKPRKLFSLSSISQQTRERQDRFSEGDYFLNQPIDQLIGNLIDNKTPPVFRSLLSIDQNTRYYASASLS